MLNGKRKCRNPFTEGPNGWFPIPSLVALRFFENAQRFSVSLSATLYPHELFSSIMRGFEAYSPVGADHSTKSLPRPTW